MTVPNSARNTSFTSHARNALGDSQLAITAETISSICDGLQKQIPENLEKSVSQIVQRAYDQAKNNSSMLLARTNEAAAAAIKQKWPNWVTENNTTNKRKLAEASVNAKTEGDELQNPFLNEEDDFGMENVESHGAVSSSSSSSSSCFTSSSTFSTGTLSTESSLKRPRLDDETDGMETFSSSSSNSFSKRKRSITEDNITGTDDQLDNDFTFDDDLSSLLAVTGFVRFDQGQDDEENHARKRKRLENKVQEFLDTLPEDDPLRQMLSCHINNGYDRTDGLSFRAPRSPRGRGLIWLCIPALNGMSTAQQRIFAKQCELEAKTVQVVTGADIFVGTIFELRKKLAASRRAKSTNNRQDLLSKAFRWLHFIGHCSIDTFNEQVGLMNENKSGEKEVLNEDTFVEVLTSLYVRDAPSSSSGSSRNNPRGHIGDSSGTSMSSSAGDEEQLLKFVSLNACQSLSLATKLRDKGIAHVLCWETICDGMAARYLATVFFKMWFQNDYTERHSFNEATSFVQSMESSKNSVVAKYQFGAPRGPSQQPETGPPYTVGIPQLLSEEASAQSHTTSSSRSAPLGQIAPAPNHVSNSVHFEKLTEVVDALLVVETPTLSGQHHEEERLGFIGIKAMGGQGKTFLLRRLAYHSKVLEHFSSGIVWINVGRSVESEHVLLTQMATALDITIEEKDEKNQTSIIVKRLREMDGCTMLLLLDNVWEDSVGDVQRFLNEQCPPGVRVVMTSRDAKAVDDLGGKSINLNELSKATAIEMLREQCQEVDVGDVGDLLVDACGRHVLALEHVGTQLRLKKSTPEKLLEKIQNKKKKLSKRFQKRGKKKKNDNEVSVFACLEMSFDNLDEEDQKDERRVALFLSLFSPEKTIPLGALLRLCTGADDVDIDDREDLGEIVKELELRSIISKVTQDGPVTLVTLHGFMHEVLLQKRSEIEESSGEAKKEESESDQVFASALPSALQYFEAYHLVTSDGDHDALKRAMEKYGKELGDEEEIVLAAVKQNGAALKFCSEKLREKEKMVRVAMKSMSGNAGMLQFGGNVTDVLERLLRNDLEEEEKKLGSEHPETLNTVNNLGRLLQAQCKMDKAEPLLRRALKGRERVLGIDHPSTLSSVNHLAWLFKAQGNLDEAEPLCRRAFSGSERTLGIDHPNTLGSVNNLGVLLQDQGKLAEAEPWKRLALEGRERVLGADHSDTLTSVGNVGWLLTAQGKFEEAEVLSRRALEGRERVLGLDHPNTLTSVKNLGVLLQAQGKLEDAELAFRRALKGYVRVLGVNYAKTLNARGCLGLLLMKRDDESGEGMVRDALSSLLLPPHRLLETHPWIKKFSQALIKEKKEPCEEKKLEIQNL